MIVGAPTYFPAGPIEVRNLTKEVMEATGAFKRVLPFRTLPTTADHLPVACVYHGGERTEPWGDANVGAVGFKHTMALVVDVVAAAAGEDALDEAAVPLVEGVKAALLTDPDWVGGVEAVERCDTRYSYPKEGETFLCVGTVEFEVVFRSEWSPAAPNDFRGMNLTVGTNPKTAFRQSIILPGDEP